MKAAIIGVTGYGGIELVRLLNNHPQVEIQSIHSSSQEGTRLSEIYPHLTNHMPLQLEAIDPEKIAKQADVVFTATPSGISSQIVPGLIEEGIKVIDLSGDFRLKEPLLYENWYKKPAPSIENLDKAVYGLPEWNKNDIKAATLLANPGCYPTATLLGLAPLVINGLIDEKSIIIDAKSGISGAGKNLSAATHYAETNENLKIYKVNQHQHIPEIEQMLSQWNNHIQSVTFSTHMIPMTRGIMTTIYGNVKTDDMTTDRLIDLYKTCYKDAPFVRVREQGNFPSTREVYGSNYCDIAVAYDERTGRVTVVSVIDNLVKGAAGQAIQNLNIMMGYEENMGLQLTPIFP
jgi:N-acetyl-gamma-glutamyl-phosphate reductase